MATEDSSSERSWSKQPTKDKTRNQYDSYHEACDRCAMRNICDGFHGDYADLHGTGEATPIDEGTRGVDDPLHYIRKQEKIVEVEDLSWAL